MITGFKDPRIAEKLKREAQLHEPKFSESLEIPKIHFGDLRCYVVEVKDLVTKAEKEVLAIGDKVGRGKAWLAQRNPGDGIVGSGLTDVLEYWFPVPGQRVEVDIFNLTYQEYKVGAILLVVQDRDGDLWIIPMGKSTLLIAEALECVYPKDIDKQAKIYRLVNCEWTPTQEIGLISDFLDANMLTIGDKVFVQAREGCTDQSGKQKYDIIGSFGLLRWGKAVADINCGTFGTVNIWKKKTSTTQQPGPCGASAITCVANVPPTTNNLGEITGTWQKTTVCPEGCDDPTANNGIIGMVCVVGRAPITAPCVGEPTQPQPPPQGISCDLEITGCQVEACNSWGSRRCIKANEKLHIRYLGRSTWDILPFQRNKNYFAFLAQDMCSTGTYNISFPQPQDFCMDADELALVTDAHNIMNLQGMVGDVVKIEEDMTRCDGVRYITQVYHICVEVPVTSCTSPSPYLAYDPATCRIISTMQQMAIMRCKPVGARSQLQLTEYYLVNDLELYQDPQADCTIHLDGNVVRLCAFSNMMGTSQSDPADFGTISFETVDAITNPYIALDALPEDQSGSGQSGQGCQDAKLWLYAQTVKVIKCGPAVDFETSLDLEIQDFVVDVDLAQCPTITYATAIVLKANCETTEETADCFDCEESGSGNGSGGQ